jgi:hypothetical protein
MNGRGCRVDSNRGQRLIVSDEASWLLPQRIEIKPLMLLGFGGLRVELLQGGRTHVGIKPHADSTCWSLNAGLPITIANQADRLCHGSDGRDRADDRHGIPNTQIRRPVAPPGLGADPRIQVRA